MPSLDLSLILPCYNEASIFEESMDKIVKFLDKTKYNYEIILIDDYSKDETPKLIKKWASENSKIRYFLHTKNQGRGATVTDGIKKATGKIVGYLDIDLEVAIENLTDHVSAIEEGYDVAFANRSTKFELHNVLRQLMHTIYIRFQKFMLKTPFNDTNAGYKFFNREKILQTLDQCTNTHWFWDTEILTRAYLNGLKMKELPALYVPNKQKKSTVKTFSDSKHFIGKVLEFSKTVKKIKKERGLK